MRKTPTYFLCTEKDFHLNIRGEIMTYSSDFRAEVVEKLKRKEMSIRQACSVHNIGKTTIQRWLKNPKIKENREKPPTKIHDELLLKDIEKNPNDCLKKRAQRFQCSKTGIYIALRRLEAKKKSDVKLVEELHE